MSAREIASLGACSQSLRMGVAPVVAAGGDPLAVEQLALATRYLDHVQARVLRLMDRALWDAGAYVALARRLLDDCDLAQTDRGELESVLRATVEVIESAQGDVAPVERQRNALASAISRIVRFAESPAAERIDAVVLEHARGVVDFARVWFLPLGWESGEGLPDLDDLMARRPDRVLPDPAN